MLRAALIALAAAFPLAAHLSVLWGSPRLAVACLGLLVLLVLLPPVARGRPWALGLLAAAAVLLPQLLRRNLVWLPLYAPSVLGDLFACWLFGHTLAAGRIALLTRVVGILHAPAPMDPAVAAYTRRLTLLWALLFGLLGVVSLGLALCAAPHGILLLAGLTPPFPVPQRAWSLFSNFIEYLVVAAFFAGEYAWRRRRFPVQPYRSFLDFVRRVAVAAPSAGLSSLRGRGTGTGDRGVDRRAA